VARCLSSGVILALDDEKEASRWRMLIPDGADVANAEDVEPLLEGNEDDDP
jgi:hypothetical protein